MASQKQAMTAIERYLRAESECGPHKNIPGEAQHPRPRPDSPVPSSQARAGPKEDLLAQAGAWKSGRGIKKIVVAVDYPNHPAINAALSLAKPFAAEVVIVHVVNPMVGVVSEAGYVDAGTIEVQRDLARKLLHEITHQLPPNALAFTYLLEGDPADQVVQTARDFDADLIVIGTHRRGPLKQFFLGSVSQAVVRKAHCPVLLVSETAAAPGDLPRSMHDNRAEKEANHACGPKAC